jgi:hypothetical protein
LGWTISAGGGRGVARLLSRASSVPRAYRRGERPTSTIVCLSWRNFVDAALVQQQDGSNHILANALSRSPTNVLRMQLEAKAIRHVA